ncbi:MAG: hypothetical protein ACRENL_10870 [Candidatus Dormibacteria bacterium]
MPDQPIALPAELGDELRRYFALTTGAELPRRVREMSARTLTQRGPGWGKLLGGGGAVLAAAALLVVLVGMHHGAGGAGVASGSGALYAPEHAPAQATIAYPGVDTSRLAQGGVLLQPAAGHGTAQVTALSAQLLAGASQAGSGSPGPAVLARARLGGTSPPRTCLCWVVEVPIGGAAARSGTPAPAATPTPRNVLVLVDAASGRIVATLSAPGIP